jgi:hypothetical protein
MQSIDGTPAELQQLIIAGELLQPRDRARLVTADKKVRRIVRAVPPALLGGPDYLAHNLVALQLLITPLMRNAYRRIQINSRRISVR